MCKKGCKKGFCSCIRTTDPGLFDHAPSIDKTARFPLRYWKAGEALHNYYLSFEDIALKVNNTPVGYVPTTSGNVTDLNTVVIDSSGDKWIIDILGNAIKMPTGGGGAGTVTSFSSGNLSPLFTTSVSTPTTTPSLSFTLTNTVTQYQAFARSAAGTGVPSWVTLGLVAFTNDYNDLTNKPTIPSFTPSALTKTDDTNITLTLGGTPATALLQAVSLTLGWTGILAIARGGTGLGVLGTANQILRVNAGVTGLEYFSPTWTDNTGTVTSFSAGNLSPLFTTSVATPTTTPALSFTLSNVSQYQVFGRSAAGSGVPSWITLPSTAFTGYTAGTGISIAGNVITNTYSNPAGRFVALNTTDASTVSMYTLDADTLAANSEIWVTGTGTMPSGVTATGFLKTIAQSTTWEWQLYKPIYGATFFTRFRDTGTWSGWQGVGLWNQYYNGSVYGYYPNSDIHAIRTTGVGSGFGGVEITGYNGFAAGIIRILDSSDTEIGRIGSSTDRMSYSATVGFHDFRGEYLKVQKDSSFVLNDLLRLNMQGGGTGQGSRISFRRNDTDIMGWVQNHYNGGWKTDMYGESGATITTSPDYGTTLVTALTAQTNGYIKIHNIPSYPSGTDILVSNAGVISYRALSSISIGSDVWRITGGNTIATSITDSIWHNANVKLGDGSSGSNSYRLQVVGTSYFTQTMLINNSTAFNALNASASPVEVFKVDSSNNWLFAASHIKVNATDIYIDQYPNTRSDSFYTVQAARLMYTDSNGKILLTDKKAFYNDHVSSGTKTQQGHAADSTWRRLTNDSSFGSTSFGTQFNINGTTFACQIPRTDQRFWLVSVIEYENQSGSSGTPAIDLQIRVNGSTTGVVFSDWSEATTGVRNTVTIQSILYTAGGGGYFDVDIYIRVATGSGSIYVNKHDTVITNVGYIPS